MFKFLYKHKVAPIFRFEAESDKPIVIACSGQSNMARRDTGHSWVAPENLRVWNYDCLFGEGAVGDVFVAPQTDSYNYAELIAAEVAQNSPKRLVYLINISRGQSSIKQWTSPISGPPMISALKSNITTALDRLGLDAIDALLWWGHESDASEVGEIRSGDFSRYMKLVIAGLDRERWAKEGHFPIGFHLINSHCHVFADTINFALIELARSLPQRFCVFNTRRLRYDDNIHLNANQKPRAAEGVFHGKYLYKVEALKTRKNLLNNTALGSSDLTITANHTLETLVPTKCLIGRVVTLSVSGISDPLRVVIGDTGYYFSAGDDVQFQPFLIKRALKETVRVALIPLGEQGCRIGRVKLELGQGQTLHRSCNGGG